jgi:HK97 family phage major capsid protein
MFKKSKGYRSAFALLAVLAMLAFFATDAAAATGGFFSAHGADILGMFGVGAAGVAKASALPAVTLETLPALANELKSKCEEVKQIGEELKAKYGEGGKAVTDELKEKADKNLTELNGLKARIDEFEQKLARQADPQKPAGAKSIGAQVSGSEAVKKLRQQGGKGSVSIAIEVGEKSITSANAPGNSQRETEIVGRPRRVPTVRSLLNVVPTDSKAIEYWVQTLRTLNAAPVAEGATKPQSFLEWTERTANVKTIAHWFKVSRQALDDEAQLAGEIDTEGRYGLMLAEEAQLLFGDGTGQNLHGLVPQATAYAAPFAVPGETMIDKLRLAMLQASLNLYPADGSILHPTDWTRIELTKDAENRYIFANPMQLSGPVLWGLPVVPTLAMTIDKFLTGAFRAAATLYDRMAPEVQISSENEDDFIKNRLTIRSEERIALAVKRAAALVYGDFGNVP